MNYKDETIEEYIEEEYENDDDVWEEWEENNISPFLSFGCCEFIVYLDHPKDVILRVPFDEEGVKREEYMKWLNEVVLKLLPNLTIEDNGDEVFIHYNTEENKYYKRTLLFVHQIVRFGYFRNFQDIVHRTYQYIEKGFSVWESITYAHTVPDERYSHSYPSYFGMFYGIDILSSSNVVHQFYIPVSFETIIPKLNSEKYSINQATRELTPGSIKEEKRESFIKNIMSIYEK